MGKVLGILGGIVAIPLFIVLLFALTYGGQEWRRYFEPRNENISREVFEQTRSYNQAKLQDLAKYRLEYLRAEEETEKQAIASTVRLQFGDYDTSQLPPELYSFMQEINR